MSASTSHDRVLCSSSGDLHDATGNVGDRKHDDSGVGRSLRRELNLLHTVSLITGVMIGVVIFITPDLIAARCGSVGLSLGVWAFAGLFVFCQALTHTEIGLLYPSAGEAFTYYKETFGPAAAFLYVWFRLCVINPVFCSMLSLVIAQYLLVPIFMGCEQPPIITRLVAIIAHSLLAVANSAYARYAARVQVAFTTVKLITLAMVIISGMILILQVGRTDILSTGMEGTTTEVGDVSVAIFLAMMSYNGWNYVFMVIEEIKTPSRTIPRAMLLSFAVVTSIYVLVNVAYFSILSPSDMKHSTAVISDFSERVVPGGGAFVSVLVALSTVGSLNGVVMGSARMLMVAARERLMPKTLSMLHVHYATPIVVIWITWMMSSVYTMTGTAKSLAEYLGSIANIVIGVTIICVLYLRYKKPNIHRPFKVPLVLPIFSLVIQFAIAVICIQQRPVSSAIGIAILLSGLPVFFYFRRYQRHSAAGGRRLTRLDRISIFLQKLLLVLPATEEKTS